MSIHEFTVQHYNTTLIYRDVFENNVFKRQRYVKARKAWKDEITLSTDGWNISSNVGLVKPMWKGYPSYVSSDHAMMFDETTEPVKELFQVMEASIPQFKYWVKKLVDLDFKSLYVLAVLIENKNIPETESLLVTGYVCWYREVEKSMPIFKYMDKMYWKKLDAAKRRQIINWNREYLANTSGVDGEPHGDRMDWPWCWDEFIKKVFNIKSPNEYVYGGGPTGVTESDVEWLKKNGWIKGELIDNENMIREYHDFLEDIAPSSTDIRDNYFRHNKKWRKIHQKNVKRAHWHVRLNGLRVFLDIPEKDYTGKEDVKAFEKRYSKYTSYVLERDNMKVYISNNIKEWEKRANALRQCIMSNKYYKKVGCVLVFIDINNNPAYTAEILENNKIGQFMGDERPNSLTFTPTQEARNMLNEFLATYKIM